MNDKNIELIKTMLYDGCIEDGNDYCNDWYQSICADFDNLTLNLKEYLLSELSQDHRDQKQASLLGRYLLVPIKEIISNERWGYNREGTNSNSRPLDFDLSLNTDEYKDITNYTIVFIITQFAG